MNVSHKFFALSYFISTPALAESAGSRAGRDALGSSSPGDLSFLWFLLAFVAIGYFIKFSDKNSKNKELKKYREYQSQYISKTSYDLRLQKAVSTIKQVGNVYTVALRHEVKLNEMLAQAFPDFTTLEFSEVLSNDHNPVAIQKLKKKGLM